jgi:hypothetical protein
MRAVFVDYTPVTIQEYGVQKVALQHCATVAACEDDLQLGLLLLVSSSISLVGAGAVAVQ